MTLDATGIEHEASAPRLKIPDDFDGQAVTSMEMGEWLGIRREAINEHARAGHLVKIGRDRYDLKASVLKFVAWQRSKIVSQEAATGMGVTMTARAAKEQAQARLTEMKANKMMGELVAVDEVRSTWIGIAKRLRGSLLAFHSQLIVRAGLSKVQATAVRKAIRELLTELADSSGETS